MNRPGPLLVDVEGTELTAADRALIDHPAVGGVILFTRNYVNPPQLAELTATLRKQRPGLLIVADYEGGRVQRFRDGFAPIPAMRTLGAVYARDADAGLDAATETGWLIGAELAAVGVHMPLAPVVDLDYGASSVIGSRAFAASAAAVAALAQALMQGLEAAGSIATAKHFPGHGFVVADSHAELPVDPRPWAALAADMAPYAPLIGAGLASIMMAHVRYPEVDMLPASLSRVWIGDILRGELGFTGCVFCDDLSMGAAAALGDYAERAGMALAAGCDYLPVCNNREAVMRLVDRVADVDEATPARRVALAARRGAAGGHGLAPLADNARWQAANALVQQLAASTVS